MYDIIKTFASLLLILFLAFFCVSYFSSPEADLQDFSSNPKELLLAEFPKFKEFWVQQDLTPLVERFGLRWDLQPAVLGIKQYSNNFLEQSSWQEYLQEKQTQLLNK